VVSGSKILGRTSKACGPKNLRCCLNLVLILWLRPQLLSQLAQKTREQPSIALPETWILSLEPLEGCAVVSRPVEVHYGSVVLSAGIFIAICRASAGECGVPERIIGVGRQRAPRGIGERYCASESIPKEVGSAVRICAREDFVDLAAQEIRSNGRAGQLLHNVRAVIEIIGRTSQRGLANAPPVAVVPEAHHAGARMAALKGTEKPPLSPSSSVGSEALLP